MVHILCNKRRFLYISVGLLMLVLAACGSSSGPSQSNGNPINITIDHTSYQSSDTIHVTVTNTTHTAIYVLDTHASCSILVLQIQTANGWQNSQAAPCALRRRPVPVKIDVGKSYNASISAGTTAGQSSFPAGTYRLVLNYLMTPLTSNPDGIATTVYSPTFTVN